MNTRRRLLACVPLAALAPHTASAFRQEEVSLDLVQDQVATVRGGGSLGETSCTGLQPPGPGVAACQAPFGRCPICGRSFGRPAG